MSTVFSSQLKLMTYILQKHSNGFHSRHCLKVSTFLIHHAPVQDRHWRHGMDRNEVCSAPKEDKSTIPSGHTSGTPSPCCPEGRPGEFSTTLRYSGSGKHGCTFPRQQCTPRWWQRPGWPDTRCRGP